MDYTRQLFGRALAALIVAYTLVFGGTFNGILNVPFPFISLALLTSGVAIWLISGWWGARNTTPLAPLTVAIGLWGAAYAVGTLYHPSGRAYIGVWYAGLYTGVWLILSDIRQRGLPGQWITDGALLSAVPLMIFALAQVGSWFLAWLSLHDVSVAFVPPRPPSVLGNPNTFGAVLATLLPLGLVRGVLSSRGPDRVLWGIWVIAAFGMLYLTYSRGAWSGAAAGLGTLGVLVLHRRGMLGSPVRWSRKWRIGAVAGIVGFLLVTGLALASLGAFETPRRGTGERLEFYRIAFHELAHHPFTGTGPFTFGLRLLKESSVPPDHPHAHAHNLILNVAAELGLPGLLALAVTCILIVRHGWRALQRATDSTEWAQRAACGAGLVALGVHSLFDMPLVTPAVMLLMLGILAAGIVQPADSTQPQKRSNRVIHWCGALVLWAVVLGTGWWSADVYAGYVNGERRLVDGDYRSGAELLREAADSQPDTALYHAEYAYACGLAAYQGDESCLQEGIAAYKRALELEAPHAVWWANLAALYWQGGNTAQAVRGMQQAVVYAPDDPDMWINLGTYYEALDRHSDARTAYRRVLELAPEWGEAGFWAETPVRRAVLALYPVELSPYRRAEILWRAGDRDAALRVFQKEIDRDSTQPGPYVDIARLYTGSGDLDRASGYLDAARLLVHTDLGQAWIYVVEAEIARLRGDLIIWEERREAARTLILPDETGQALYYGREVAYFQFLRVKVRGTLLPQVHTLGPDPVLVELLQSSS